MGEGIFTKLKNYILEEEVEEEIDEAYEEGIVEEEVDLFQTVANNKSSSSKVVNLHNTVNMKVVIVEPKSYDEVTLIADHLKQKKAVIANLENMEDPKVKKAIFDFMNGAVYVLEGEIQRVSKGIYILAPNNVNIDSSIKKELESKTLFPWQNK